MDLTNARKPYASPKLAIYGEFSRLTAGGSAGFDENKMSANPELPRRP